MSKDIRVVTRDDCGVWIEGASVHNPVEFSVAIVDLAIANGFELETQVWEADKPKFLDGSFDGDMLDDLSYVADVALEHLQHTVREGFYFDFEDGLVLYYEDESD